FERVVSFPDGRRGRVDLFKAGCCVIEAKCFHRAVGATSGSGTRASPNRRRTTIRRGTPAWERAMRAAAQQGARYAGALADQGRPPPFVIATDSGYAFDLYRDVSGAGRAYVRCPDFHRILMAELVREEVRAVLRAALADPQALHPGHTRCTRELVRVGRLALPVRPPAATEAFRSARGAGVVRGDARSPWPTLLAEQACAVRRVVAERGESATVADVAGAFAGARSEAVAAVLDALTALGLIRAVAGGGYAEGASPAMEQTPKVASPQVVKRPFVCAGREAYGRQRVDEP